ncbi:MAG: hypothetical protein FJW90_02210 [Actinobacteria bacterium]|nr:hypothetical protein [Actinomycetota bacterium]
MEVALAALAAFLFALGTTLQQKGVMAAPARSARGIAALLLNLARRPVWLGGIVADALGFIAQAIALGVGRLAIVQPVLTTTIVFALPLGAWLTGQRILPREIVAALAVTAGISAFLLVSDPAGGRDDAPVAEWLEAAVPIALVCAALVFAGSRSGAGPKAALYGSATGILFGLSAALTKATVDQLDEGAVALLTDWHFYALLVVGYLSMTLSQLSLQTGVLAPAIATASILDPIASVVLGVTLLQEKLHEDTAGVAVSCAAFAVMLSGLVVLARSRGASPPGPPVSA